MWKYYLSVLAVVVWLSLTSTLAFAFYHSNQLNQELRVHVDLLRQVRQIENDRCEGIYKVNTICEKVVTDFASRLGLDVLAPSQILTTGITKRYQVGGMGGE